ncbi:MAG: glycosyltransferase [Rhodospirillales bacterium]
MSDIPVISAVVPVRDEAGNIDRLIAELERALRPLKDFEIVYVDDGSIDGTGPALTVAVSRVPELRVLRHARSCGQSAALWTGVRAARAAWVVTLDGDGQNDPADFALLLKACDEELKRLGDPEAAVMVCGRRARRRDALVKRLSSRVANAVRARLLGDRTPDAGCSLKLFRRRDFLLLPYFDHMHRFLPALMLRQGGHVLSVDVNHRPRMSGRSNYGVFDRLWIGIVDLLGVMWLMRRARMPEIAAPPADKDRK